jgi:hypothetical protein
MKISPVEEKDDKAILPQNYSIGCKSCLLPAFTLHSCLAYFLTRKIEVTSTSETCVFGIYILDTRISHMTTSSKSICYASLDN